MVLQTSGSIRASDINSEIGQNLSARFSFQIPNVRDLAQSSLNAQITFSKFYGKSLVQQQANLPPVAGYSLWLDASDATSLTMASNLVSEWRDKSGNGYHFTQTNSTYRPVYDASLFGASKPGIWVGGTSMPAKGLSRPANTSGTLSSSLTLSLYFVVKTNSTGWNLIMTNWFDATQSAAQSIYRIHYSLGDNGSRFNTLYANGVRVLHAGAITTNTNYVCGFTFSGQNIASRGNINGTTSAFTPSVALPSSAASSTSHWWIGDIRGINDVNRYQTGGIGEILAYSSAMTSTQEQSIISYLKTKWNIP